MWAWIKNHSSIIITALVTVGISLFMYACEPKVPSLNDKHQLVTRPELQLEFDGLLALAKVRMASLDKQDEIRKLILHNALIIVQGQPLNPVGIITGVAGIYGLLKVGSNVTKVVKEKAKKARDKNGTT